MIERFDANDLSAADYANTENHEIADTARRNQLLLALYTDLRLLIDKTSPADTNTKKTPSFYYELPEAYTSWNTDKKAQFLSDNSDQLIADEFIRETVLVGAARMDEKRVASGRDAIHVATVKQVLASDESLQAYYGAQKTIFESPETITNSAPRKVANLIADHLDENFNNPVMLYEVVGMNYRTRDNGSRRYPFLDLGRQKFMENNDWSPKLQALMSVVGMHQTAMYSAKSLVWPLLTNDKELIPDVKEGFEEAFWRRRIVGTDTTEGVQYYLGYIQKSRVLLDYHMEKTWGENSQYNRMVFTATGLMKTGLLNDKEKSAVRKQRRAIYHSIAVGDFASAKAQLQVVAKERPELFSRVSQKFLLDE